MRKLISLLLALSILSSDRVFAVMALLGLEPKSRDTASEPLVNSICCSKPSNAFRSPLPAAGGAGSETGTPISTSSSSFPSAPPARRFLSLSLFSIRSDDEPTHVSIIRGSFIHPESSGADEPEHSSTSTNPFGIMPTLAPAGSKAASPLSTVHDNPESRSVAPRQLLPSVQKMLNNQLLDAIRRNCLEDVQTFVARGAQVNATYKVSLEALNEAAKHYAELFVYLAAHGSYDDATVFPALTPLLCAARNGFTDIVKWLITNGADVTQKDNDGKDALWWAQHNGHEKIAQRILDLSSKH